MVVADWQFEYNGLTFGSGLTIGVVEVEGLSAAPTFKTDIVPKTGVHGSSVFADFYEERHVIITGDIYDNSGSVEAHINSLRVAFAARTADTNLLWKYPGLNRRRLPCRPMRFASTIKSGYDIGVGEWVVELVAADPAIYDDITSTKLFDG